MVRQLSSLAEFNTAISSGNVVVVDFFATWCGPCKVIAPAYEKMASQYKQATFLKCDVDQNQDISKEQGVRAMPTFNIYKGGKKVATIMGADARKLEAAIREHAGAPSSNASDTHNWGAGNTLGSETSASQAVKAPLHQPAIQTGRDVVSTVTNLDPSAKLLLGLFVVYILYVTMA